VSVAIIINPISGTGGRPEIARRRAELAASLVSARGERAEIFLTERGGHARELALGALDRGATTVVAWGGDGTVNEVATALAFRQASLAVVPGGSGNGLARELGIPRDPSAALTIALGQQSRVIDCGELDGRLFVNVAGIGLDARVAHEFAAHGLVRRGFLRYIEITARELIRFEADEHTVLAGRDVIRQRALIVAIANARQYGNGALIAPDARIDDGKLAIVAIADRPLWQTMVHVPRLFTGGIASVPGVWTRHATEAEIVATRPMLYHVDGEPFRGGTSMRARAHPAALRVKVAEHYP
jgi:YegS/Rv2252/BmrU family lipid kinase